MVHVVSVHSFRGGTGKSNITANVAVQVAQRGRRVGVIDTDIQSPGIHVLFGLTGAGVSGALNDYLFRGHPIRDVAHDVTPAGVDGRIHLIPSSVKPGEISRVLREGYDAQQLVQGLRGLVDALDLDVLLIDTHPGLGEETLLSLVISDTSLMVLRPDHQDYEGTGVLVDVARSLDVPRKALVVNKVPAAMDADSVRHQVERTYRSRVVGVLAHEDAMMALGSGDIFTLRHPGHPLTAALAGVSTFVLDPAR